MGPKNDRRGLINCPRVVRDGRAAARVGPVPCRMTLCGGIHAEASHGKGCPFLAKRFLTFLPCYLVTLLSCYPVTLLPCYLVTLLPCYPVTLLPCYLVTLLPCYPVTLLPFYLVTLLPCYPVTLLPCYPFALLPGYLVTFYLVTLLP